MFPQSRDVSLERRTVANLVLMWTLVVAVRWWVTVVYGHEAGVVVRWGATLLALLYSVTTSFSIE
jgi:hypothetical protein